MKRLKISLISTLFAIAICSQAGNVSNPLDTIMCVSNPASVTLTETAKSTTLTVISTTEGQDSVSTYTIDNPIDGSVILRQTFTPPVFNIAERNTDGHPHDIIAFNGLHFGFVGSLGSPAGTDIEMGKSYEIGIDNLLSYGFTPRYRVNYISIGIGINWRNWRMTGNTRFIVDDRGNVTTGDYPQGVESRYSRVKVFSLGFPIEWLHTTNIKTLGPSRLKFKLSAILNWNSHASVVTCWTEADGTKARQGTKQVNQRRFSVDIQAAIGFAPAAGLYVKYSPMTLFKDQCGPRLSTISTGVYLCF